MALAKEVWTMAHDPFLADKREGMLRICAKHGARNIRVFGSFARGEAGPDSDIDLLVDVEPVHTPWFPGGLLADLEEYLGRNVDIVEPESLHWYIRDQILEEAVPL
jgi:hypothetical protein